METLTEKNIRFIEYTNIAGEEITFQEWSIDEAVKYREFEPAIIKYAKYGLAALIGVGILSRFTTGVYRVYRMNSDACVRKCGGKKEVNRKCFNMCYMQACKAVMNRLRSDYGQLSKIKDSIVRRKVEKKIKREFKKWKNRYEKYKLRTVTSPRELILVRGKKRGKYDAKRR